MRQNFTPLQGSTARDATPWEHWETILGTGTQNAVAEAVLGSLNHNVPLPPPVTLAAGGL